MIQIVQHIIIRTYNTFIPYKHVEENARLTQMPIMAEIRGET